MFDLPEMGGVPWVGIFSFELTEDIYLKRSEVQLKTWFCDHLELIFNERCDPETNISYSAIPEIGIHYNSPDKWSTMDSNLLELIWSKENSTKEQCNNL